MKAGWDLVFIVPLTEHGWRMRSGQIARHGKLPDSALTVQERRWNCSLPRWRSEWSRHFLIRLRTTWCRLAATPDSQVQRTL